MSADSGGGARKAAAFLLSLDKTEAAKVLAGLDENVLNEVAAAMGELDEEFASADAIDTLYTNVAKTLNSKHGVRSADDDELLERLSGALGNSRAQSIIADIHARRLEQRPFSELEEHAPNLIALALNDESPSAIALVLAHVDPSLSAQVLSNFEGPKALATVKFMASLTPPAFTALRCVADALNEKLTELEKGPISSDPSRRLKTIAEMLTFSAAETEQTVLEGLGEENGEMVEEIREYMFAWIDLAEVDQRSMQKILASVDTKTLAIALKGSPPVVEENIMANLSSRVKDMVVDERELLGQLPISEVLESRAETLRGVRALIESGEFKPSRGGEELVS